MPRLERKKSTGKVQRLACPLKPIKDRSLMGIDQLYNTVFEVAHKFEKEKNKIKCPKTIEIFSRTLEAVSQKD